MPVAVTSGGIRRTLRPSRRDTLQSSQPARPYRIDHHENSASMNQPACALRDAVAEVNAPISDAPRCQHSQQRRGSDLRDASCPYQTTVGAAERAALAGAQLGQRAAVPLRARAARAPDEQPPCQTSSMTRVALSEIAHSGALASDADGYRGRPSRARQFAGLAGGRRIGHSGGLLPSLSSSRCSKPRRR